MSSAKPGKVDEIHEASKSSNEEHASKRKTVDANATDARSQNWTQYNEGPHQYGPPDTARQTGNVADGTYSRDKAPSYTDPMMVYSNILPHHIDPRILITGSTNNQLNMTTSSSFQIQNNTPQPSMAYPVTMEPYSTYAFPVMIDQRFNATRDPVRPEPMPSPFTNPSQPGGASGMFSSPYLPQKGPLQDVDRSTSDIFGSKRNQLRAEFLARSNTTDPGSSEPNTSDRPDSANTNSSNPESGNDLEDEEDELTGKRRPILKTNEDRRVHHKLVEQERRKTMNKYINRLRELMDIPAPTKGRGLKKSIVLEKACEYVDKIHDYVATLYNANQQLMNALNMRGVTPQMMAQLNIPFVPPPPSHIYPPSNYRAPQYVSSSPMNQRVADPHTVRGPMPYPPYFKPEMHGQHIDQPFPPHHIESPLINNNTAPNPFNANLNPQQPPNPNSFNNNAHTFSEKHTEP